MQGIVLSRRDFREFDQIISVYTPEQGKIEMVARGVKKIQSKNSAGLEPGQLVEFGLAKGKEMSLLTSVTVEEDFTNIRLDYRRAFVASFLLDTVDRLVEKNSVDERIFLFLCTTLLELQATPDSFEFFLDRTILQFFSLLGYTPILGQCALGGEDVLGFGTVFFHPKDGGVICPPCLAKQTPNQEYFSISQEGLRGLVSCLDPQRPLVATPFFHRFVFDFVAYYSEKKLPDWSKVLSL